MANYFEKIPLWSNNNPSFDILADKISGRIPVTRLENWKDFAELLESDYFNQPKTQLVFRGHRRFDWSLAPTLARIPESEIIDKELAEDQLNHFKKAVRGRLSDNVLVQDGEEDELWAVGQHHGLMTPLLDWTHSPYVALFFAFSKEDSEEEKENPYRAVYVLNKTFVADDEVCPDIRMFEPRKDDHGRLVNQAGLFTFSPYDSTIENKLSDTLASEDFEDSELRNASEDDQAGIIARYVCKIYIKNEDREGCMLHLQRMNVHHASLFPDLIGASQYCNLMTAKERRTYEIEQSSSDDVSTSRTGESSREETIVIPSDENLEEVVEFAEILDRYRDQQVEPGRIQFIAEHLSKKLTQYKVVDWHKRDSAISRIRSFIRISLRKYGYPHRLRDKVVDEIVAVLIKGEDE